MSSVELNFLAMANVDFDISSVKLEYKIGNVRCRKIPLCGCYMCTHFWSHISSYVHMILQFRQKI